MRLTAVKMARTKTVAAALRGVPIIAVKAFLLAVMTTLV